MAIKITVTKAIEEKLRAAADDCSPGNAFASLARQLVGRIDDARNRKATAEKKLGAHAILNVMRGVLGTSLILPPMISSGFRSWVANRVAMLGMTLEDVERAAERAKRVYRHPMTAEWVVKTFDRLCAPEDQVTQDRDGELRFVTGRGDDECG